MYGCNKYVRFDDNTIIIFSPDIAHVNAARGPMVINQWDDTRRSPVSAGFIEGGKCVGNSVSLGLKSKEGDTGVFRRMLGLPKLEE
jgi:hypothetical protein